ncbi:MAG: phage holin family protein [Clostridia bacterium]|nr:phage holin family protein [Clostridia bacterium]
MDGGYQMKTALASVFTLCCTTATYLFGGWDVALAVLVSFMAIDYLTGVVGAVINKKLSSHTGFKGLAKKLFVVLMLIVSVMLDRLVNGGQWIFRTLVAYFYIANEGISIIENVARLGVPIPQRIVEILEQIKEKE